MKALFNHELYVVRGTHDIFVELQHPESKAVMLVQLSDDRLVLDPEAGDIEQAERGRMLGSCCDCPHEVYLTTSVSRHEHECRSCGERFIDAHRTKRYFGHAPR